MSFYNRSLELSTAYSAISSDESIGCQVFGERRIGKSALLQHIVAYETRKKYLAQQEYYLFVLINFASIPFDNPMVFFDHLLTGIRENVGSLSIVPKDALNFEKKPRSANSLLDVSDMLNETLSLLFRAGLRKLIILLDEFDHVIPKIDDDDSLGFLRALTELYRITLVTATTEELSYLLGSIKTSGLSTHFTSSIHLGLFSTDDAIKFTVGTAEEMGIPLGLMSDELVHEIINYVGSHPFYLRLAVRSLTKKIILSSFSSVCFDDSVRTELNTSYRPTFVELWNKKLSDTERAFLIKNANNRVIRSQADVCQKLKKRCILELDSRGKYQFFSETFRRFVLSEREQNRVPPPGIRSPQKPDARPTKKHELLYKTFNKRAELRIGEIIQSEKAKEIGGGKGSYLDKAGADYLRNKYHFFKRLQVPGGWPIGIRAKIFIFIAEFIVDISSAMDLMRRVSEEGAKVSHLMIFTPRESLDQIEQVIRAYKKVEGLTVEIQEI